jgi:hypothetical protein
MAAIILPKAPDGEQFEDFVAASLRALGYFVETRITLREEKKEVLELDVVATPAGDSSAHRELYEAKKHSPTFEVLFKLFGQRTYLGIDRACLATLNEADAQTKPVYEAKGKELQVRTAHYPLDAQPTSLADAHNPLTPEKRDIVVRVAWYLQIAKRIAQAACIHACKSHPSDPHYEALRTYAFKVHASFFAKTPLDRAEALYSAYFEAPKLTGQLVSDFATTQGVSPVAIWNELNGTSAKVWLQHQMVAESVSRIAIIKHALDHVVAYGPDSLPTITLRLGTTTITIEKHALPHRFVEGLKTLHAHPHSLRLPYLYQTFMELAGGFVIKSSDDDLEMFEQITGVPKAEIVPALLLLDEFFAPVGGSLFYTVKDQLLCCKMVPGFIRAIGSFLRLKFMDLKHYDDMFPVVGWLLNKWHGAGYEVLKMELPEVSTPPKS